MRRRGAIAAIVLFIISTASAAPGQGAEPVLGALIETDGAAGAGLLTRSGGRCLALTVRHLVDGQASANIVTSDAPPATGAVAAVSKSIDAAVLTLDRPPAACPAFPSELEIERALQVREALLLVPTKGGRLARVPITVTAIGREELVLEVDGSLMQIQEGMSGSPVVMNGTPVAILRGVDAAKPNRPGLAVRLDHAARILGPQWFPPTNAVQADAEALARANAMLRDAIAARPTADMGQAGALQVLAKAKKAASGLDLAGIGFGPVTIDGLVANDTNFLLASFPGARLEASDFSRSDFAMADLSGTSFTGSDLSGVLAVLARAPKADFTGATLSGSVWSGADLQGARFGGAKLNGASFGFADLRGADFRGAAFDHLVLVGADLRGARFDQAGARSIDVTGALFDDRTFPPPLEKSLCGSRPYDHVRIKLFEVSSGADGGETYEDLMRWEGPMGLDKGGNRYFPTCPPRQEILSSRANALVISRKPGDTSEDRIRESFRVDAPSALLGAGNRRRTAQAMAKARLDWRSERTSLLATSNHFYTDRDARIVAHITAAAAKAARPSTLWMDREARELVAAKYGLPRSDWSYARFRFATEDDIRRARNEPPPRDSWSRVMPDDIDLGDLTPAVIGAIDAWSTQRIAALPSSWSFETSYWGRDGQRELNGLKIVTADEVMDPYDLAETPARKKAQAARAEECAAMLAARSANAPDWRARADKLGYAGPNEFVCRNGLVYRIDRAGVLAPSWYKPSMTLARYDKWLLALETPFPDPGVAPEGVTKLIASGVVRRSARLPRVPGAEGPETPVFVLGDIKVRWDTTASRP